jgi:hypothetical protein
MATNVWNESTPPGSQDISLGDDRIRELKLDIRERGELEHRWNESALRDGYHKRGSARCEFGLESSRPATGRVVEAQNIDIGRLFYSTDIRKLFFVDGANNYKDTDFRAGISLSFPINAAIGPIPVPSTPATFTIGNANNRVLFLAFGTGFVSSDAPRVGQLSLSLDGTNNIVGWFTFVTNNVRNNFVPQILVSTNLAAGNHTVQFVDPTNTFNSDGNDYYTLLIVEIPT